MDESSKRRPVVVGIAGDQAHLLSFALGMAQMLDAPLRVVHACAFRATAAGERALDDARKRLAEGAGVDVEYALRTEPPAFALEIESKDAAVLVLGADDVGWFDRLAGAEVARRVALHSTCPVLVVPPSVSAPAMDDIVVALDVDNVSEDALDFGFDLGERTAARVRVVTVLPPAADPEERQWRDRRLAGFVAKWHRRFPHANARHEVITGRPADELARGATQTRLVIVGRTNQPHHAPLVSQRVAGSLLRAAECPVAVVPAGHHG